MYLIAMVKKFLYLITALIMFHSGGMNTVVAQKHDIDISPRFQKYFDKLNVIYADNNIYIDYSQVVGIYPIDSLERDAGDTRRLEGVYHLITKKVYINPEQIDAFFRGNYDDMIMLIMAHEIAHSQGKMHVGDKTSIMYASSAYVYSLLRIYTVEKLVTDIYTKDYSVGVVCPKCGQVH